MNDTINNEFICGLMYDDEADYYQPYYLSENDQNLDVYGNIVKDGIWPCY